MSDMFLHFPITGTIKMFVIFYALVIKIKM